MTDEEFNELTVYVYKELKNEHIFNYMIKTRNHLKLHNRIAVSYSGGSDSDIVLDLVELVKPPNCGEIRYVFFDTGLEWDATIRHVKETSEKYGVDIKTRDPRLTIPVACKKYGIPFISKDVSQWLNELQSKSFNWRDTSENATPQKYGKVKAALDWFFDRRGKSKKGKKLKSIAAFKYLFEFIRLYNPSFKISKKCCKYAKKDVAKAFYEEFYPDLCINGMRKVEGGARAGSISSCLTLSRESNKGYDEYRPLWFWTDEDKRIYKEWRGIKYSDCYEVWGFKRTGCVGCPCASESVHQLEIAKQYEPKKVKAAYAVFGASYEYRKAYNEFKKRASININQMSIFGEEET